MKQFVLDCSVTMAWCFDDEADPRVTALVRSIPDATVHVPCLWALEVANVLLVGERRGRLTEAKASVFLCRLEQMPIQQEPTADVETAGRILTIAREHDLSAYDAAYLELAMRLGLPLATLDERLRRAADAAGVELAL